MSDWWAHSDDGVLLGSLGVFLAAASTAVAVRLVTRWRWKLRALAGGLAAEGRVLEVDREPGDQGRDDFTRTVVWFYAPDGHEFRIEDSTGRPRVLGERVPLLYLPERPQWAVVAGESPGTGEVLVVLAFCGLFALGGVVCLGIGLRLIGRT